MATKARVGQKSGTPHLVSHMGNRDLSNWAIFYWLPRGVSGRLVRT